MYGLRDSANLSSFSKFSLDEIRHGIEAFLKKSPRSSVYLKTVVAHEDPIERFKLLDIRFNDSEVKVKDQEDHYQVDVKRKIKRSGRIVTGSFAFFKHDNAQVWTAITAEGADFFNRGLAWLISESSPVLSEFYATSRDLEIALDTFNETVEYDSEIIVTQAVAYSHREEGEISYKTRPYPEVFKDAREGGNYVNSITFESRSDRGVELEASIYRDGTTTIDSGDVELFFNYLLKDFIGIAQRKAELFQDKERSPETGDIQELEVQFDKPVFQSPRDNQDLIQALGDLSRSSVTVYHKNPYAHLSVLDFNDGSSCDVFVTDSKTISIVPSYRGSTNFLMRISDKIYKDLDESAVELVEQASYGVEDFVGG